MDSLDDLASAARDARSPAARPAARASHSSSAPVVLAILFGSLVIGGAIVFVALHRGGTTQAMTSATSAQAGPGQNIVDAATLARQVRAQTAAFLAFANRLGDALARQHKATLEADNAATSDTVVRYTCNYTIAHTGTLNAPNGRPTTFQVLFNGTVEGKGQAFSSTDTAEIAASFTPGPDGSWGIEAATEKLLTRKTSADLFGVPEKDGPKRDIAHLAWFNAAVRAAQKPAAAKE
jgi:hypothetical protein